MGTNAKTTRYQVYHRSIYGQRWVHQCEAIGLKEAKSVVLNIIKQGVSARLTSYNGTIVYRSARN